MSEDMQFSLLLIEAILDLMAVVLGCVMIARAHDNGMRFGWGLLCIAIAGVLLFDNLRWIFVYQTVSPTLPSHIDLLQLPRMLKWVTLLYAISLLPLSSLRPGFLTTLKLIVLSLPVAILILVAVCYYAFNGTVTTLTSQQDVAGHIDLLDVRLRLGIFIITLFIPPLCFFAPMIGKWAAVRRKATPFMYVYIFSIILMLCYHVAFTLYPSRFIFNTFGLVSIFFCISYAIALLRDENPFSIHDHTSGYEIVNEESLADILFGQMNAFMTESKPFVTAEYSIEDLTRDLNAKPSLVTEAIKCGGFSGYRDYINYLRIEHFKQLAQTDRNRSVKELMFDSGFTSRATFYRLFSNHEQITPTEYIERLYKQDITV